MKPLEKAISPNKELFVIERAPNSYILYSPLNKKVGVINHSGVNTIARYLDGETLADKEQEYIDALRRNQFLNEIELAAPVFPDNYAFMPHEVTLFATSRCNLRCRYCYADAGKKSLDMSMDIAKTAIDLVAKNAGLLGLPQFTVGFHGGGEPTVAWELVSNAVDYAHEKADEMGLNVEVFAATNGMFTVKQRDFIIRKFSNLNISIDGPEDIQNYNRPTANGAGSFEIIKNNLKFLDEHHFSYGVRSTITAKDVCRIEEIVAWFKSEFNIRFLHLEPVWQCGRCLTSGEFSPSDDDFINYFIKGSQKAKELGIDLIYSGLRLDSLISKFCGAAGDGFNILPDGTITSCYEITENDDPKAALFHYGKYVPEKKEFVFDNEKIKRLQKYSVENLEYCRDCFCKWHCAGDCISKVFDAGGSFEHKGSSRCYLNRQLTIHELETIISNRTN
ncbi:MAG: radical SAM protein [Tannerellaceae bacterium]|jgi:uncharacterized protein|nr:radical SAM protein [Tannerellaceae bacterium]